MNFEKLKAQFDWLTNGGISMIVDKNLPRELVHLEMYLR
jgi:hypothetical protein